jgi:hypothetical protein
LLSLRIRKSSRSQAVSPWPRRAPRHLGHRVLDSANDSEPYQGAVLQPLASWKLARAQPAPSNRGCSGDCMYAMPFSSGWRRTSKTWSRHSGRSSRKSMPWYARDTSSGQWHLAAADQADIRDGVMGGMKGAHGDQSGANAGEAGDAGDAGSLEGFGQRHRRQAGGMPTRQPRLPSSRRADQQPGYGRNACIRFSVIAAPRAIQ